MILFIDDEPGRMEPYLSAFEASGLPTRMLKSAEEVRSYLEGTPTTPDCIILDVMFPGDGTIPPALTGNGMRAGQVLFAALRGYFSEAPIVVFTSAADPELKAFFGRQKKCWFLAKARATPRELAVLVQNIVNDEGDILLRELAACLPGRDDAVAFERLMVRMFRYLFVPPFGEVLYQARRGDGMAIRDIVLSNNIDEFFWSTLRAELKAKHIVVECKNFVQAIRQREVQQLRIYLGRQTIGKFGLLISRCPPSESAKTAQRDAYTDRPSCLILLLHDKHVVEMCHSRQNGKNPADVLQALKEAFELGY